MTEPTMRERVARAICRDGVLAASRALGTPSTPEWVAGQVDARWRHYADVAGDVLKAMREPTRSMINEGDLASTPYYPQTAPTSVEWRAMIDAALAEKPGGD